MAFARGRRKSECAGSRHGSATASPTEFSLKGLEMTDQVDKTTPHVDPKLLEILVCPLTKGTLEYDRDAQELISRAAGLAYPIRDGIPIMLPDEARVIEEPGKAGTQP